MKRGDNDLLHQALEPGSSHQLREQKIGEKRLSQAEAHPNSQHLQADITTEMEMPMEVHRIKLMTIATREERDQQSCRISTASSEHLPQINTSVSEEAKDAYKL